LKTRIVPERIPLPAQPQLSQRDALREAHLNGTGDGEKTFDQRDGLIRFAGQRINLGQRSLVYGSVECIATFRLQLDPPSRLADGSLFPAHIGVKQSQRFVKQGLVRMIARSRFQLRRCHHEEALCRSRVATRQGDLP